MQQDETAATPAPGDTVIVDLERGEMAVIGPERRRVAVDEHRPSVVRRLLARGLSPTMLRRLLPELCPVIDLVAEEEPTSTSRV